MTDVKKNIIKSGHPAQPACHLLPLCSPVKSNLSLSLSPSSMINTEGEGKKRERKAGETGLAFKTYFTLAHASDRLSPSERKAKLLAFPFLPVAAVKHCSPAESESPEIAPLESLSAHNR